MTNFTKEDQTIQSAKELLETLDLGTMIKNRFFKNHLKYPTRKDFQVRKVCKHCGSKYHDKEAYEKYKQAQIEWREEDGRLNSLFRDTLLLNHNIEPSHKADLLVSIAWERGHSAGFYEVYNCFEQMVDMLK